MIIFNAIHSNETPVLIAPARLVQTYPRERLHSSSTGRTRLSRQAAPVVPGCQAGLSCNNPLRPEAELPNKRNPGAPAAAIHSARGPTPENLYRLAKSGLLGSAHETSRDYTIFTVGHGFGCLPGAGQQGNPG